MNEIKNRKYARYNRTEEKGGFKRIQLLTLFKHGLLTAW